MTGTQLEIGAIQRLLQEAEERLCCLTREGRMRNLPSPLWNMSRDVRLIRHAVEKAAEHFAVSAPPAAAPVFCLRNDDPVAGEILR